jgi:hypothetical protein
LLQGAVWGGIRWHRALGRPVTANIAGGFVITHEYKALKFTDLGGGNYRDDSRYVVQPAPSVWDATASGEEYRVGFLFFAGLGGINPNRLTVTLAPFPWDRVVQTRAGYRRLDPIGYAPFGSLGEVIVLPDLRVLQTPYRLERYIEPLGPSFDEA